MLIVGQYANRLTKTICLLAADPFVQVEVPCTFPGACSGSNIMSCMLDSMAYLTRTMTLTFRKIAEIQART